MKSVVSYLLEETREIVERWTPIAVLAGGICGMQQYMARGVDPDQLAEESQQYQKQRIAEFLQWREENPLFKKDRNLENVVYTTK